MRKLSYEGRCPGNGCGLTDNLMDWADLVSMIDNRELQAKIDQAEKPPKIAP
jgi:hypothetical protein